VCDLETSRMGAPYIYDISRLRVNAGLCQRRFHWEMKVSGKNCRENQNTHSCSHVVLFPVMEHVVLLPVMEHVVLLPVMEHVVLLPVMEHATIISKKHFHVQNFVSKIVRLWDNLEKYCRAGQSTDGNLAQAH